MIRTLAYVAASLLLIGTAYGEDKEKSDAPQKKPEAKAEAATKESTEPKTEPTSPRGARRPGMRGDAPGHREKSRKPVWKTESSSCNSMARTMSSPWATTLTHS